MTENRNGNGAGNDGIMLCTVHTTQGLGTKPIPYTIPCTAMRTVIPVPRAGPIPVSDLAQCE